MLKSNKYLFFEEANVQYTCSFDNKWDNWYCSASPFETSPGQFYSCSSTFLPGDLGHIATHLQPWILQKTAQMKGCVIHYIYFPFFLRASLSPRLWQTKSMAASTILIVTLRPSLLSSGRHNRDVSKKSRIQGLTFSTGVLEEKERENELAQIFADFWESRSETSKDLILSILAAPAFTRAEYKV